MCGIAGFVDGDSANESKQSALLAMTDAIAHRGPDASGHWISGDGRVALGHRRLSIQDLSEAGAQPMASASGRYTIVFNGEIYNFQEMRPALEAAGHAFRGHSDTEVLLAAIEEHGLDEALARSNGMFAFALWDDAEKTLSLARDRIGEKPLYYGSHGGAFLFASELAAIEAWVSHRGAERLEVDPRALASYLRHGYVPAPHAIFRGFHKLEAGSILTLDLSIGDRSWLASEARRRRRFWSLADVVGAPGRGARDGEALHQELERRMLRSVERQLIADVPVGTFLSGGIDSTLVTALATRVSSSRVNTYTVGFDEKEFDEARFAARIAEHLQTDHHELQLTSRDALDLVPDLPRLYSEPFANASQIPTHLVSRFASEHVKVCLTGDGGDELFAGYNRYTAPLALANRTAGLPASLTRMAGRLLDGVPDGTVRGVHRALGGLVGQQSNVDLKVRKAAEFLKRGDLSDYYTYLLSFCDDPAGLTGGVEEHPSWPLEGLPDSRGNDFVEQAQYRDQLCYLPDDCLAKMDRASMAVGLEVRAPLLAVDVIEWSWEFSVEAKLEGGHSKAPLRRVLYEHVPRELIDRPKMGFTVPIGQWLVQDLRSWVGDLFETERRRGSGLVDMQAVDRHWQEHTSGRRNHANLLWAVAMYLAWDADRRG